MTPSQWHFILKPPDGRVSNVKPFLEEALNVKPSLGMFHFGRGAET